VNAFVSSWLRQFRTVATLKPFDTATEVGRANERYRRVFWTAVAFGIARVVSLGTMVISYPIAMRYLGEERFGLWVTLSSLVILMGFADLGVGNGLLNAIAGASGRDDTPAIRRYVSSAFVILSLIAVCFVLCFVVVDQFVAWADVFNLKTHLARRECERALEVLACCFALSIPAGIVQRTQTGLQLGFLANLWQAAASGLALLAVLLAIHLELGLPWLTGAVVGVPALVAVVNGVTFFGRRRAIAPTPSMIARPAMIEIARAGLLFLLLQLAVSVAYTSDNIVIARVLGADVVPYFAVPEKLFSVIPLVLGMVLMPLWPAYGEAAARGDGDWIRRVFVKSLGLAVRARWCLPPSLAGC
jgi:O-antigen/teichoic acid export membrane protein